MAKTCDYCGTKVNGIGLRNANQCAKCGDLVCTNCENGPIGQWQCPSCPL